MANGFLLRSLPFDAAALTSLQAGAPAENVQNDFMGMVARAASPGIAIGIRADLGANPPPIDTFAALGLIGAADTTGAILQGGSDPTFASWSVEVTMTPAATERATAAGRHHGLHLFATPQTWRYWYLRITTSVSLQLEIARLLLGTRVQPGRNFSFGVARGVRDLGEVSFSSRGAVLRRSGRRLRTLDLSWDFLTKAEAEGASLPLLESVGGTGFVLACLDPAADPERSRRLYYGPLAGNSAVTWRAADLWQKRLQMQSVI